MANAMTHNSSSTRCPPPIRLRRARLLLALWSCALMLFWLVVLPWWADRAAMRAHLTWLNKHGIDPSAMYYTELEAMQPILQALNERQRGD